MPISMPAAPGFRASRFGLVTNTQKFESPLTKAVQRVRLGGARWEASYTLPQMNAAQAAPWLGFLLSLQGSANTFSGFDPDRRTPRGVATGTPLVKGAGQNGTTLIIDGCTASVTGWLLAGDYFNVNGYLHMLTQNADTNGSGETTLTFQPPLRGSPADNAAITVTNCTVAMVLSDDRQAMWETNENGIYREMTFAAMEVFS